MKPRSICLLLLIPAMLPAAALDGVVKTDAGLVAGLGTTIRAYRGIPYAASPVGGLRWKAPQPAKPWTGVRMAAAYGPICPQLPLLKEPQNEDCLTLNVWTPAHAAGEKLPVMVWIHGGGFTIGASSQSVYDGAALAAQGVVVVSLNYRLGVLGFLAHPALSKESADGVSGNYGILDMVAGLEWVRRNIDGFGGDPGRVTVFGESAGGTAVFLLMAMPRAAGLFQQAISESGAIPFATFTHLRESRHGRVAAESYGARLGDDIAALRKLQVSEVVRKTAGINTPGGGGDIGESFIPVVDGVVLPDDPNTLFASGRFQKVPLIAGTNADEGTLTGGPPVRDLESMRKWLPKVVGAPAAANVMAGYGVATDAGAHDIAAKISGDWVFLLGTRGVLRAAAKANPKAYQYCFTRVSGIGRRLKSGAFHASEIGYVFHNLPDSAYGTSLSLIGDFSVAADSYGGDDALLQDTMSAAWVRFAKTGDPNGGGMPRWPAFGAAENYLEFGDRVVPGTALRKAQIDVLATVAQ